MILPQAKPVGWSNPLKNLLRPLGEVAYSVQAFDWSALRRPRLPRKFLHCQRADIQINSPKLTKKYT